MNVLIEIGSTNPADNEVDGNGSAPIRNTMETLLGSALEDELVIDATIANSDAQRDALWDVRNLLQSHINELARLSDRMSR